MAKLHIKKLQVLPGNVNVALVLPEVDYDFITLPITFSVKLLDETYRFKDAGNFCRVYANLNEEVYTTALTDKIVPFNKIDDANLTITLTEELEDYDFVNIYLEADEIPTEDNRPEPDAYIVSPEFIRSQSNISSNIQDKFLQQALREVTDIDYRSLVGTKMLKKLKCLIYDEKIHEMDNIHYLNLLQYSKYYLLYMVNYRILPVISVKMDNAGAYQTSDEHVEPVSIDDTFKLATYYEQRANYYKKMVQQYIIDNIKSLPEIEECNINAINANLKSASMTGLWLGGKRGRKYIGDCKC